VQNLVVDSGAGNTTVALPEKPGLMTAEIDGGVGNVTLRVPDGVQARINVDSGIGNVDVDSRFTKQGDNYVTSGYDSATDRIDVALDMGVGNVKVSR
jgi:predicted membrane protein